MSVRLLFPTYIFHRNFLDPNLNEDQGYDLEYNQMLIDEIDAMRQRDPVGRSVSNASTPSEIGQGRCGWQSKDGCESSPVFQKCMNRISRMFGDEVLPFFGIPPTQLKMKAGNSWANINERGSWNRPHLHNGCWFSGVLYIKADGDEGNFEAIDCMPKVVSNFPGHQRMSPNYSVAPRVGDIHLFPSGLMHMVEPNFTDKERYSISFNMDMQDLLIRGGGVFGQDFSSPDYNANEFTFDIDGNGNPIR